MAMCCSYRDCFNKSVPCSKLCFFSLPLDPVKRKKWIKNSGNPCLIGISPTSKRVFCEKHFDEKYLRRQFNRTTLHPDAEIIPWSPKETFIINVVGPAKEEKILTSNDSQTALAKRRKLLNEDFHVQEIIVCHSKPEAINEETMTKIDEEIIKYPEIIEVASPERELTVQSDETEPNLPLSPSNVNDQQIVEVYVTSKDNDDKEDETIVSKNPILSSITNTLPDSSSNQETEVQSLPSKPQEKLDEDQYFCLNVVSGLLKRLTSAKKAEAKLHILSYLYKLEQEES